MPMVDVQEATMHLPHLLDRAAAGEEIVIGRAGEPVARLVPLAAPQRRFGSLRGQVWIADDFDDDHGSAELFEAGE